jgi:hypothetical protein
MGTTTRTTVEQTSVLDGTDRVGHACYIARVAGPSTERRCRMNALRLLAVTATAAWVAACSDPTELRLDGGVAVSFSTRDPGPAPAAPAWASPSAMLDDTITTGPDTLIITSAQIVLREIELKRAETVDCDVEPEPEGCEEVEVGPILVDLPLTAGAKQQFFVEVPPGTYTRIDFEIHKPDDGDPADLAFITAHPEFVDVSIRVEGTFNGSSFTFVSDLNVEQELDLVPPLTVAEQGTVNVTVRVGLDGWFRSLTGDLIDPATGNKGEPNESLVTENIKTSVEAFEDDDRNGRDD